MDEIVVDGRRVEVVGTHCKGKRVMIRSRKGKNNKQYKDSTFMNIIRKRFIDSDCYNISYGYETSVVGHIPAFFC